MLDMVTRDDPLVKRGSPLTPAYPSRIRLNLRK